MDNDQTPSRIRASVPYFSEDEKIEEMRDMITGFLQDQRVPEEAKEAFLAQETISLFISKYGLGVN
ncbi:MAG: hypothetical protein J5J00_02745 [Deltaproteobacteria bacterium]|nr:hypothetical protein [Deltaproteobacteria bacterium]